MSSRTKSARTMIAGTVGTSPVVILAANTATASNFIRIINPALPGGNNLQVTYDGSVPVIGVNGIPLFPGGTDTNDAHIPTTAITIIADTASTPYCIEYA